MTKEALLAVGHEMINYRPTEHLEAEEIISRMWEANGGEEFQRDTDASGEPLPAEVESWLGHSARQTPMAVSEA